MANNRIALEEAWCNLLAQEKPYFKAAAKYLLCKEGINYPTDTQIQEKVNYLFHLHLSFSILYGKPLSDREVEALFKAACGEDLKESAEGIDRTPDVIKRHRMSAFKKLQAKNIPQATYLATRLGYLPIKREPPLLQSTKNQNSEEELENTSA